MTIYLFYIRGRQGSKIERPPIIFKHLYFSLVINEKLFYHKLNTGRVSILQYLLLN